MKLHVKIQGEGKNLLLIHGLFGRLNNLQIMAQALAPHYRVISLDLPNHGLSAHTDRTDYPFLAEIIRTFLHAHQIEQLSVIGHSMGGKVAMQLALMAPNLIDKLAILDIAPVTYTNHHHRAIFDALTACAQHRLQSKQQAHQILARYINEEKKRQFLLASLYKKPEGNYDWRFNFNLLIEKYTDIMGWQAQGTFNGPTLFLKAANSPYITPQHRDAIRLHFPHAKAHIMANTTHWLHVEKPQQVNHTLLKFLGPNFLPASNHD